MGAQNLILLFSCPKWKIFSCKFIIFRVFSDGLKSGGGASALS